MSDFFAMGGHAAFIWPCYGLAVIVMAFLVVQSLRSMWTNEKLVETLRAGRARRRDQRADPQTPSTSDLSASGKSTRAESKMEAGA